MRPWNPNMKSTGWPGELNPGSSNRPSWLVRTVSRPTEPPRQVMLTKLNQFSGVQPVLCVMTTDRHPASHSCYTLSWDSLQQRRAHNRVWMLYCIRNGLVAIPPDHLKPTTVTTRRYETHYMQIRCNSCMYSQTFFPSAVRLWNRVPPDICYLPPDSFKSEMSKINLI